MTIIKDRNGINMDGQPFTAPDQVTILRLNEPNGDYGVYAHDKIHVSEVRFNDRGSEPFTVTLHTLHTQLDDAYLEIGQDLAMAIARAVLERDPNFASEVKDPEL